MAKFKTFDEFLDLFPPKPRQRIKNGFNVLCPCHEDHGPSLSITQAGNRILLDCKGGCDTRNIVKNKCLTMADLFLNSEHPSTVKPIATYTYQNLDGSPRYIIKRFPNLPDGTKVFKANMPDGTEGIGKTPRILYRAPEIIKAREKRETIHIVEGEKDVETLRNYALTATTPPFGANSRWLPEYTDLLRGAKVVIIPDTDPPGLKKGNEIATALYGTVTSLKLLELQSVKDITEWLDLGGTIEFLKELIEQEPKYTPLSVNTKLVSNCVSNDDLRSNSTEIAQKTHNFGVEDVREFVRSQGFRYWEVRNLDYELGISSTEEKHYRRRLCSHLEEKKEIEKHSTDGRKYRQISQDDVIDYKSASQGNPLDLWLPFDIHRHFNTYPGNLLDFAGVTDSGKTALAVNIIRNNDDKWTIDYWTNELSAEELNERLQNIDRYKSIDDWKFTARVIKPGYLNKIRPDILSIFDYIDVGDPYYNIGEEQQSIHDAIGKGVAIIFLQRDEGRILGRGKAFSVQLPRLYISMDSKSAYAYKAKTPKNPANPFKGKTCDFKLTNGVHFEFSEWKYKNI